MINKYDRDNRLLEQGFSGQTETHLRTIYQLHDWELHDIYNTLGIDQRS